MPKIENGNDYKNYLINGNFENFQRTVLTAGTTAAYVSDRWKLRTGTGGTTQRIAQQTSNPPLGAVNYARIDGTVGNETIEFDQFLEDVNVAPLKGKTVIFSLALRRSANFTPDILIRIYKNATANTSTGGSSVMISSVTVPNASISSGTASSDWAFFSVTAQIPNDGTANGLRVLVASSAGHVLTSYIEVASCMLTEGMMIRPFKYHGDTRINDQTACKRFYELGAHGTSDTGNASGSLGGFGVCRFNVEKRVAPTVVMFNGGTLNQARNNNNGASEGALSIGGVNTYFVQIRSTSALSDNIDYTFSFTADAEL